jgi:large subunit ribosomal protein L17
MRHRIAGRKLSRTSGQRRALYRNLVTDLFRHERLETTLVKARAIRSQAEKLITLSRRGQTDRILELARANNEAALSRLIQARRARKLLALALEAEGEAAPRERIPADAASARGHSDLESAVRQMGVHARRRAAAQLNGPEVVQKLFDEIGPRYQDRSGGYTRILKLGHRKGDAAPMALIELVTD